MHFSFDVFDTAVCRLLHSPEHIHLIVGRKLRNRGIVTFSDNEWMYARTDAEFQQRLTVPHREVTLKDIYERLARSLNLSQEAARIALETEFSEELRLIRPITSTRQRVNDLVHKGKSIFFLSDTYFTSNQVRDLLEKAGYTKPLDVIASSEQLKSKMLGSIFGHVADQRGVPSSSFQHFGDNSLADLRNARANGWNAEAFDSSHWTTRERVLFASGNGDFLSSAIAGSARAARLGQVMPVNNGVLTAAASVVGPLFAAYVMWILLDVIARGGRRVHFLARDGQVLVPIFQRLALWLGADIEARYTYASRQAFLLPALPDDKHEIVDQAMALAYYDGISLSDAMTSLKYSKEEIRAVSVISAIALHEARWSINDSQKVALREALNRPEFLEPLIARSRVARTATMEYLKCEGVFSSSEAYIVDLGWRGNTQLRMQRMVGDRVTFVGYYMGLSNSVLSAKHKRYVWSTTAPWKTSLLEVMAAADHTSVKGFGLAEDGRPICVPALNEDSVLVPWGAREQQKIALRFVENLTDAVELEHHSPEEVYLALRSAALNAYRHFQLSPARDEADAYGGIPHHVDVNHLESRELAQPIKSMDLVRHVFDRQSRSAVTSWYMGSIARSTEHVLPGLIANSIDRTFNLKSRVEAKWKRREAQRAALALLKERLKPENA